jgi:hypothetical protein
MTLLRKCVGIDKQRVLVIILTKERRKSRAHRVIIPSTGGRDSAPVRGVPYEPAAPYRVYRAKFESVEVLWAGGLRPWRSCDRLLARNAEISRLRQTSITLLSPTDTIQEG